MEKDYRLFEKEDFLEDAFFLEWVKYGTPAATAFWEAYRQSAPANLPALEEAVMQIQAILSLERIVSPPGIKEAVLERVHEGMSSTPVVRIRRPRKRWLAAAVMLPLLAVAAWYLLKPAGEKHVASGYGETVRLTLPDSSQVVLNANSELTYGNWNNDAREVWLKGEALFTVKPAAGTFSVHAGEVRVDVLGTVFNVKQRRGATQVYLVSGKVKITADGRAQVLQPGMLWRYDSARAEPHTGTTNSAAVLAWTRQRMELSNATIKEITDQLRDIYGYQVILEDSSIANRSIDGTLHLDDVNSLLFELSVILNAKIETNRDTLIFHSSERRRVQ